MRPQDNATGAAAADPELLRAWFRARQRELPWRLAGGASGLREPYRSWLAEIMLQQTQVATVLPYFEAFLERFPTVEALAAAAEAELLQAWAGLGYYRRARLMQQAAQRILAQGGFPQTHDGWLSLPGIGPYTAAALASLVNGEAKPVVDGNVKRVVARLEGLELRRDDPALHRAAEAVGQAWMARLDPHDALAPGELNEALMELGATVCRRQADCAACVWASACRAHHRGQADALPLPPKPKAKVDLSFHCLWIGDASASYLTRRESGWNPGFLEPPLARSAQERRQWEQAWELGPGQECGTFRHAITHHRLAVTVWHYPQPGNRALTPCQDGPLTTVAKKALAKLSEGT